MGKFWDEIPDEITEWLKAQRMFWVASAPLSGEGHVNISPKGHCDDTLQFVNSKAVYYLDMTGSGNETISHLKENGRMTILFTAFEEPAQGRIVRLFGYGKHFELDTPEFNELVPPEDPRRSLPGLRAVIWLDIHKVGGSCGYSIPFFTYTGERDVLHKWATKMQGIDSDWEAENDGVSSKGMKNYWKENNAKSIDGLPGLKLAGAKTAVREQPEESTRSKLNQYLLVLIGGFIGAYVTRKFTWGV